MKWYVDDRPAEIQIKEDRLPPHDADTEAAALGCILLCPEQCGKEIAKFDLNRRSFYMLAHQTIFECISRLVAEGKSPDVITVVTRLRDDGQLEKAGGMGAIAALPDKSPTAVLFEQFAERLNELRRRREIIQQAQCISSRAFDLGEPLDTLQNDLQRAVELNTTPRDALPEIEDMSTFLKRDVPEPPQLVYGVLHQGSKLVFGGGSKSYKTWTLTDLAVAVACGEPWLSMKTTKAKVLYINFEMFEFAFQKRARAIEQSKNIKIPAGQIDVWNLRGFCAGYTALFPRILQRIKQSNYGLIVLDPIYKTYGETDENAAGAVAMLMNAIEELAVKTGAAVAFGAHYAKGNAAGKEAIDRISGSGVFARDPDTIINFTRHEAEDAFTFEATLRNFKPIEPFVVRWIYPLMRRDENLDPRKLRRANAPKRIDPLDLLAAIEDTTIEKPVSMSQWASAANVKRCSLYEHLPTLVTNGWVEVIGESSSARRYISEAGLNALNKKDRQHDGTDD